MGRKVRDCRDKSLKNCKAPQRRRKVQKDFPDFNSLNKMISLANEASLIILVQWVSGRPGQLPSDPVYFVVVKL